MNKSGLSMEEIDALLAGVSSENTKWKETIENEKWKEETKKTKLNPLFSHRPEDIIDAEFEYDITK